MVNVWNVKADKIGQQSLHVPKGTRTLPPLRFGMGTRTSPQVFVFLFFCKMFNKKTDNQREKIKPKIKNFQSNPTHQREGKV